MRPSHATSAIVLRARPFGEADRIITFLTEEFGKITGIAKGAMRSRKRFVNSLEPFAYVNLRFQDRPQSNLVFILAADLIVGYHRLAANLECLVHAAYLVEITDGLIGEREENCAVFQHLRDGLRHLEERGTSLRFLTAFELKLLSLAGYQPILDYCNCCDRNRLADGANQWYFSLADGGILCNVCATSRRQTLPLSTKAVEILTALRSETVDLPSPVSLPASVIGELRAVTLRFIQFHMDREIKSAAFLQQFSSVSSGVN